MSAHREHLLEGSMIEPQQGELFFHTDFPYDCVWLSMTTILLRRGSQGMPVLFQEKHWSLEAPKSG